ncbi:MAG: hypothetical protein RBS36_03620 [Thiomicrospira sp.]|nr:hypothetical protein [Thiomicrospira sp.]
MIVLLARKLLASWFKPDSFIICPSRLFISHIYPVLAFVPGLVVVSHLSLGIQYGFTFY